MAENLGGTCTCMRTYKIYEERALREFTCRVRGPAFQHTTQQSMSSKLKACLTADELLIFQKRRSNATIFVLQDLLVLAILFTRFTMLLAGT